MKRYLATLPLLGAIFLAGCASTSNSSGELQLARIAETWLQLLDEEKYQVAWDQTTAYFRSTTSYEDFLRFAQGARHPLGKITIREIWRKDFRKYVKGRPDGQYFIASFQTSFQNQRAGTFEHVILENEAGDWKVTRYVLR